MYVSVQWYERQNDLGNSNNVGLLFTTDAVSLPGNSVYDARPILREPQVNEVRILTGTNWMKVSGYFLADQPYRYLTIGNFFDNNHTLFTKKTLRVTSASYYNIDDVTVVPAEQAPQVEIPRLGNDLVLCPGQPLPFVLTDTPNTQYKWQDGSTSSRYTVTKPGTYWVNATTGTTTFSDTVRVNYLSPISLPADTVLCRGETLTLAPAYAPKNFVWNDGSQDSTLTVLQSGQYWVEVVSAYCTLRDTINVQVLDCPGAVPNVFTPNGDGINDVFQIDNIELLAWRLEIYNRWGRRVYESDAYRNDWRGEGLPAGVYYYGLSNAQTKRFLKGWVQILR